MQFKLVPIFSKKGKPEFININYIYALPDYEAAYRCDYEKYEKSSKLAIPPNEDLVLKEEFTPCETTYKQMRHIMLNKKFEGMYTEALNQDDGDKTRVTELVSREEARRAKAKISDSFNQKGVYQTYDEKNIIKMIKGPFYQLIS